MLILRLDKNSRIILRDKKTKQPFAVLTRHRHPIHPGRGEAWKIKFEAPPSTEIIREPND